MWGVQVTHSHLTGRKAGRQTGRVPAADWLARHDVGSAKPALLRTARDAARGRLLTLLAGLFAVGALVFTALNFNLSRRTFELAKRDLDVTRAELARARQEPGEAEIRAAGRRGRDEPEADADGDEPERSRGTGPVAFWRSNATALGVAAAALGGVFYVLLTWVTSWVYQPAGVKPSDVGLGYTPLLAGTAVTLVAALAVVLALVAVALGATWLLRKAFGAAWLRSATPSENSARAKRASPPEILPPSNKKQAWALAVVFIALLALTFTPLFWTISGHSLSGNAVFFLGSLPAAVFIAIISGKRAHKVIAIVATIVALVTAVFTVWDAAAQARRDIQDVSSSAPIGLSNLWEGEIANIRKIGSTSTAVTCGLYLGESNGTGVFVVSEGTGQFKHLRTFRLPLSSALIEILPDQVLC